MISQNKFNPLTKKSSLVMMALLLGSATAGNIRHNVGTVAWSDPFCNTFTADGMGCIKCSQRYYKDSNGQCQQVSDDCRTWDHKTGACTGCYQGYTLCEGVCVIAGTQVGHHDNNNGNVGTGNDDDNCAEYGFIDIYNKWHKKHDKDCKKVCIECDEGYYIDAKYKCVGLPDNCQAADVNGNCTDCADNYHEVQGVCYPNVSLPPVDDNCAAYKYVDAHNNYFANYVKGCKKVCIECDNGFYLDANSLCVGLPGNCLQADVNGNCTQCQAGYCIEKGQCVIVVDQGNSAVSKKSDRSRSKSSKKWRKWGQVGLGDNSRRSQRDTDKRTDRYQGVGQGRSQRYSRHSERDTHRGVGQENESHRWNRYESDRRVGQNQSRMSRRDNDSKHTEKDSKQSDRNWVGQRFGDRYDNDSHRFGKWAKLGSKDSKHQDSKQSRHRSKSTKNSDKSSKKDKDSKCSKKVQQKSHKDSSRKQEKSSRKQSRSKSVGSKDCQSKKSKHESKKCVDQKSRKQSHSKRSDKKDLQSKKSCDKDSKKQNDKDSKCSKDSKHQHDKDSKCSKKSNHD